MKVTRRRSIILGGIAATIAVSGCVGGDDGSPPDIEDKIIDIEPEAVLPPIEDIDDDAGWRVSDNEDTAENEAQRDYSNPNKGEFASITVTVYDDLESAESAYEERQPDQTTNGYDGGTEGFIDPYLSDENGEVVFRGGNVVVAVFGGLSGENFSGDGESLAQDFAEPAVERLAEEQDE